jgi:hypothetical protein
MPDETTETVTQSQVRQNLEERLKDRTHIFRADRLRQELDGNSSGVLSNLDCRGVGPVGPFTIGRKVAYHKKNYINWVVSRITDMGGV